jgi:hypothetical protein
MRWNEDVGKKEKICPMTLRDAGERFQGYKCLGAECMEWRSSQREPVTVRLSITNVGADEKPMEIVFSAGEKENTGYCGMAGPAEQQGREG